MNAIQFNKFGELNNGRTNDVSNFFRIKRTPRVQRVHEMRCIEYLNIRRQHIYESARRSKNWIE